MKEKKNKKSSRNAKKKYEAPKLHEFGSVKYFTRTVSMGPPGDASAPPYDRVYMTMCISSTPQIEEHRVLLHDQVCQEAFREAINQAVRPGDVVLDLGTGSGLHAFFAAQAGAKKVYAVDCEPILEMAKETSELNGFGDTIEFIYARAEEMELPEKVDVIITNIGFLATVQTLPGVREKFLKAGGRMVPDSLQISFAPLGVDEYYNRIVKFWDEKHYGLDFSPLKRAAVNHPHYIEFTPNDFLASPKNVSPIDLHQKVLDKVDWQTSFEIEKDGVISGLLGWYGFFTEGKEFMNTKPPLKLDRRIWSQWVLPLERPLCVKKGDRIEIAVSMMKNVIDDEPAWLWTVQKNGETLSQSSMESVLLSKRSIEQSQKFLQ